MARIGGRTLVALVASCTLSAGLGLAQGHGGRTSGGGVGHAPGLERGDRDNDRDRDWKRDHDRDEHNARYQRSHHAERHDDDDRDDRFARPPGWSHGRKTGWGRCDAPPGLAKKEGCHEGKSVEHQRIATATRSAGTRPAPFTVRKTAAASTEKSQPRNGTTVKKKNAVRNATPTIASAPKATKGGPWVHVDSARATRQVQPE